MRLSVFDLDHTLISCNSSYFFGHYLYREKFFSFWSLLSSLADYARHKYFGMSIFKLHTKVFKRLFKGRSIEEINRHVNQFLNVSLDAFLYEPIVKRLEMAKIKGEHVLIISSSPDFLVKEIARRLNVSHWEATRYEIDLHGMLTTLSHVMEGENKARYLFSFIEEKKIDQADISVYSDSYLDLPILKLGGNPVGVNPDSRLKRICKEMGWEIVL